MYRKFLAIISIILLLPAIAFGARGHAVIEGKPITTTFLTAEGTPVSSANDITLGTDGNVFDITGVTTINTITSKGIGTIIILQFDGILQLTHSADLFLPTAANITTAAGDVAIFYEYATGDWRCSNYMRASGIPLIGGAPFDATYITQTSNGTLTNEQALAGLSSGIMRVATTTGAVTSLTDSAGIFANVSDETGGTGVMVGSVSPTFTTDITVQGLTGTMSCVNLTADAGEDNSDLWRYCVADSGGNATLESFATGSWVAVWTITNAGAFTVTGSATANGAILDGGTNTFSITNGTASLDVAAAATVNIDKSLTVDGADLTITLSSPSTDQGLVYDGTKFVNAPIVTSGAGPGILFFMDDTSIIATGANNDNEVNTLTKVPDGSGEIQDDISCTSGTSPVQGESFLYDTALGGTALDAGEWLTDTYTAVDSTIGGRVSSITRNIYHVDVEGTETMTTTGAGTSRTATASGGTPFVSGDADAANVDAGYLQTPQGLYQITAFTNGTTVTIETPSGYSNEAGVAFSVWKNLMSINTGTITSIDPAFAMHRGISIQAIVSIDPTDKLAESVFAICNNTTIVSFTHNGSDRFSHFHSPLITRHNDLEGLDEGNFQHMTAAENTGTGSGVFVRTNSPALVTPKSSVNTVTDSDGFTMSAAQCLGTVVYATGAGTIVMCPAIAGGNFSGEIHAAASVVWDPDASGTEDTIRLNGVDLAQGANVTCTALTDVLVVTYYAADKWSMRTTSGCAGP